MVIEPGFGYFGRVGRCKSFWKMKQKDACALKMSW